eukprot:gb/GECH01000354.1/.p1 GENE.gb/GECH01000354.1/~~gb/GECH01000354.1/.p1  ORF type:complete len:192 (+),score=41.45 gb/GECH01000354.1/:1-576(+)
MSKPGAKGAQLVNELKQNLWLPPYNEETIREILSEMQSEYADIYDIAHNEYIDPQDPSCAALLLLNHTAFMRNKRCISTYLHHRLLRLRQIRWNTGGTLPDLVNDNISTAEKDYFQAYSNLIGEYGAELNVDLGADVDPPKDVYIEVRALRDVGEITTATNVIQLRANQTFYMRRTDAEPYILQGILKQVV